VAGGGVLLRVAWPTAPKWLGVSLYVIVGWLALIPARELLTWFAPFPLLVLGGVLYTLGGIVYALRKPNPWPRVLGYHEIFHLLVIADNLPEKQQTIGRRPVPPGSRIVNQSVLARRSLDAILPSDTHDTLLVTAQR